jgi:hypothetical protein
MVSPLQSVRSSGHSQTPIYSLNLETQTIHRRYTLTPRRIIRCWRHRTWGGSVEFELSRRMNRWFLPSKRRFIWCWSRSLGASLLNLNATVGWTNGQSVGSSGAEARSLDPYCSQTLRHRMNWCQFIRRSILNLLAAELIRRVLILTCRFIRR